MQTCLILDDYQDAALGLADWARLSDRVAVSSMTDHVADQDALVARIDQAEILVIMRERTPFPAALLKRLPRLKLLVTSGMRNLAIDVAAARGRGVTVCGTESSPTPADRADLGADPRPRPPSAAREQEPAGRRTVAEHGRDRSRRGDARPPRVGQDRHAGRRDRPGFRHAGDRLEPESGRRPGRRRWGRTCRNQGGPAGSQRRRLHPSGARRPDARASRDARGCAGCGRAPSW